MNFSVKSDNIKMYSFSFFKVNFVKNNWDTAVTAYCKIEQRLDKAKNLLTGRKNEGSRFRFELLLQFFSTIMVSLAISYLVTMCMQ
jgi:hypothetical protein